MADKKWFSPDKDFVRVKQTKNGLQTYIDEPSIMALTPPAKAQLVSMFQTVLYMLGAYENEPTETGHETRPKN